MLETPSEVTFVLGSYVDMRLGEQYAFTFTVDGHTFVYPEALYGYGHTTSSSCNFWDYFIEYDDHAGAAPNDIYTATQQLAVTFVDTNTAADGFTPWLSASDYQAEFDRQLANNYYPVEVEGRNFNGESQYRGKFVPYPPSPFAFYSIHSHTQASYESINSDLLSQGYTRIFLQTFVDLDGITRYQATWTAAEISGEIRYISFVEGDPGIAGNGIVINGISDVNPSLSRFTLSDPFLNEAELENGITISVYSQPAPAETRVDFFIDYPGGSVPGCNIIGQANPNPPPINPAITINGAQGISFYLSFEQVLQVIRNSGCQEPTPNELQIRSFFLVDDTLSGRTPRIDAVAFGVGQDAYPTE